MEFEDTINKRHSVRDFKPDEIPEEILREIIKLSERTPSWENSQPWNVYIATGETLSKIKSEWESKYAQQVKSAPDMPTGHRTDFSFRGQKNMADFMDYIADLTNDSEILYFKETNKLLFNAPALIYLTLNEGHTEWSTYDLGAFGMILMLAAKNLGVDSIPAYEIVKYPDVIREYMDVPDDEEIVMGIALGYESDDEINKIVSTRLALDDILTIKK